MDTCVLKRNDNMNKKLLATAFAVSSLLIGIDCLQAMDCTVRIGKSNQEGTERMLEIGTGKKVIRANIADLFAERSGELGNGFGLYYAVYENCSDEYVIMESDFLRIELQKGQKDINNLFLEITDKNCSKLDIQDVEIVEGNIQKRKGSIRVKLRQSESGGKNGELSFVGDNLIIYEDYNARKIDIRAKEVFIDSSRFSAGVANIEAGVFILGQLSEAKFVTLKAVALNEDSEKREYYTFCEKHPDSYSPQKTYFQTRSDLTAYNLDITGFYDVSFKNDDSDESCRRVRPVLISVKNLTIDTINLENTATFIFSEDATRNIKNENGKLEFAGLKYTLRKS